MKLASTWALIFIIFIGIIPLGKFELYTRYTTLDTYMHFLGGFVLAWFLWQIFKKERRSLPWFPLTVLIVGGVAIFGIVWEIAEYFSNLFLEDSPSLTGRLIYKYFHGGDKADTLTDLALNIIGAVVFSIGSVLTRKRVA